MRYARRRFERPRVDLVRLTAAGGALAGWAEQRLVPKVVLATQTRVLEPAVDERGAWLPSVPAITVIPREERLWHVAAALASPVAAAWALRETAGMALGATAIKLGARHVRALPAPAEGSAWDEAAAAFRTASAVDGRVEWRRRCAGPPGELPCVRAAGARADALVAGGRSGCRAGGRRGPA